MGYAEKRGKGAGAYWRGRYKTEPGRYGTVQDEDGAVIRFAGKREAKQAADGKEADLREKRRPLKPATATFGQWARTWYSSLDLAASTMANYTRHLEDHLLRAFEHTLLADLDADAIEAWARQERADGYKPASIRTWRATLHAVLAAAADRGLIGSNPATRRRGTGKRAGRKQGTRGPEKVITDPLGALLIAERASILAGRDDEFTGITASFYTGMRWAEIVGLERQYFRLKTIRVEWQLYELPDRLERCPPKDDSYRDIDLPPFLSALISGHIARTSPRPCPCHGHTYIFSAHGRARGTRQAVTLHDVAEAARVSAATVSNVLNHAGRVSAPARDRVQAAAVQLGFTRNPAPSRPAPHWRRSGFGAWIFGPAASGWYPAKAPQPRRTVPLAAEPWPGAPVRGRNNQGRAEACWVPVAPGLTEHGLRHSHKSLMAELRTPEVLSHERLGHELGGIAGVYSHVTPAMRADLMKELSRVWQEALDARLRINPRSPVRVLDDLLRARSRELFSQDSPSGPVRLLRVRG